ncbi:MAG: prephenate/arogenate dehydrogenase family protein, partial [Alphaproteobacteria bacterium]
MAMIFDRIAVLGVGLIGSSIAHAARESGVTRVVQLYDANPEVRQRARELGLGEVFDDPVKAVEKAELVVLCVPVGAMASAIEAAKRGL